MKEQELRAIRDEYEDSNLTIESFAEFKGMEYWKMKYALKKGLHLKRQDQGIQTVRKKVGFKKVVSKGSAKEIEAGIKQLIIRTSSGLEIIIPI